MHNITETTVFGVLVITTLADVLGIIVVAKWLSRQGLGVFVT